MSRKTVGRLINAFVCGAAFFGIHALLGTDLHEARAIGIAAACSAGFAYGWGYEEAEDETP